MARDRGDDADFMTDLRAAVIRGPRIWSSLLIFAILGFFTVVGWWTSVATIPTVARGEGKVIPSSQNQTVQHFEGGILAKILVREGQIVKRGDILLRVDDIQFKSRYREDHAKYLGLLAASDRLRAEARGGAPRYSREVLESGAKLARSENELYRARTAELKHAVAVLERQVEQRRQELVEIEVRIAQLDRSLVLAREELSITQPMVEAGVTARIELVRLQRGINDIAGTLETARQSMPRARAALRESEGRIEERRATARAEALAALNDITIQLAVLKESLASMKDRVRRTDVRSPVDGTVKQLKINTVGGVIQPGMDLIEIVPSEDNLLIEAHIRPADIGFLRPDQDATVKITAYDYTEHGSLDATLVDISPDAIVDEQGESYFQVRVRTDRNYLGKEDDPKRIIPGMVAQVDILTGDRTVLDYMMKPILRARERAFRER